MAFIIKDFALCFLVLSMLAPAVYGQGSAEWQQRVSYEMDITLLADRHRMRGHQRLRYQNNSPDTLRHVFYHLYFNAFHPGSMMAERNRHLPDPDARIVPRIFNLGPDEIGFHRIESLSQDGRPVAFEINDTVMKVELAEPIPPGRTSGFEMRFDSQVPLQTRRSGRDNREGIDYSMSQWYPKIANYDERGWHADPYVGREFYGPFGTFDVRITLPSEYVIGATGVLQNPGDVGHGYGTTDRTDADSLTWHFLAEDVHDFAWAADPDYVHEQIEGDDGTVYHLLYQGNVADRWDEMSEWAPQIIEFYSRNFGKYPYPQFSVIQAGDGGMEYPMLTFIVGNISKRGLLSVTAHEAAHMWYYGILGSNEADYAWMDEGFASYAETEFMAHLSGGPVSRSGTHLGVLRLQHLDLFERMNTPADWFGTNSAYSNASYTAGEMLVDLLGYVISDSLRDAFLLEYFDRFTFRHPDPFDVEKVAEDVSGVHLDWYFDQLTNSIWTLDYAVDRVDSERVNGGWETAIRLERKGSAVLPIDLRLTLADGSTRWVNIPLSIMQGHKPVPPEWIIAEPWQWTFPEYTLLLNMPQRVVKAEIDPLLRTPDANRLNNTSRFPVQTTFLNAPSPSWSTYQVGWRPILQYADAFGLAAGIQLRGTYIFNRLQSRAMVKVWPQVVQSGGEEPDLSIPPVFLTEFSWFDGIDFEFALSDEVDVLGAHATLGIQTQKHLGIWQTEASASFLLNAEDALTRRTRRLTLSARHQKRTTDRVLGTQVSSGFLTDDMISARAELSAGDAGTRLKIVAEAGGAMEDLSPFTNAHRLYVDLARRLPLSRFTASVRGRVGFGSDLLAVQKAYRLGAATFEDRWENDAYRTVGALVDDPLDAFHWEAFEGPGPVAYARRRLSGPGDGIVIGAPVHSEIVAAGARLLSPPAANRGLLMPLRLEAFMGVGRMDDGFLADAGLGLRYNLAELPALSRWVRQSDVLSGMKLRARFPLWVSDPELTDHRDAVAFRWLLGVSVDDLPWE